MTLGCGQYEWLGLDVNRGAEHLSESARVLRGQLRLGLRLARITHGSP